MCARGTCRPVHALQPGPPRACVSQRVHPPDTAQPGAGPRPRLLPAPQPTCSSLSLLRLLTTAAQDATVLSRRTRSSRRPEGRPSSPSRRAPGACPWPPPLPSPGERAHTRHTPLSGPLPHPFQVELKQPRGTPPRPLSEHLAESPLGLARGNRWHSALRPRADAAFCRGPTSSCTTREGLAQGPPPGSGLGIVFLKLSGTTQELATSALRTTPVYT